MSVSARGEAIEPGTVQDGQKLNGQPFNGWSLVMQPPALVNPAAQES